MAKPILAWSFSALETWRNCAHKFAQTRIFKNYSDDNKWNKDGTSEHEVFDAYLKRRQTLIPKYAEAKPLLDKLLLTPGQLYSEFSMALNQEFQPCAGNDWNQAWVRMISDVLIVNGAVAYLIDWKTGKVRPKPEQNELVALGVFQHFPAVTQVRATFAYVQHNRMVAYKDQHNQEHSVALINREEAPVLWQKFLPDVKRMTVMKQNGKTPNDWPKNENPLCAYCPVGNCEFNVNPDIAPQFVE